MTRELTQQEIQVFQEVLPQLRLRGIKDNERNGDRIVNYFSERPAIVISSDSILQACNDLVSKLEYDSNGAREFNLFLLTLTPDEATALQYFFDRKPLIGLDGDARGFENAVLLISWCRRMRKPIDFPSLTEAMNAHIPGIGGYSPAEAAVMRSRSLKQLHFKQAEKTSILEQEYIAGRRNHAASKDDPNATHWLTGKPKQEDPRAWVNGRRNHAVPISDERPTPEPNPLNDSEQAFKRSSEGLLNSGRTHSQNAELQEVFANAVAANQGWRYVFQQMTQAKRDMERVGRRY